MQASLLVVAVTRDGTESVARALETLTPEFPAATVVVALDGSPDEVAAALAPRTALTVVRDGEPARSAEAGRIVVVGPMALGEAIGSFAGRVIVLLPRGGVGFPERDLDRVRAAGGLIVHEVSGREARDLPARPSDVGAPAAELGATLADLIGAERQPELAERRMLHLLLGELREAAGIDFREYKAPTIVRRLALLMQSGGFPSVAEYVAYLRRRPEAYAHLVGGLLINVTEFFRDPPLFAYLRDEVLPDLIAHAGANEQELRVWSAGCATGEEAYSIAMLVADALGDRLGEFRVRIFATDVDEEAIAFARRALYPRGAFDGLPPEFTTRYFTETRDGFEVKKRIRALTVFGQHDLAQRAPFPRIDLCLCRNVLIYFTKELQQRTLQLFAFSLRNDGYLVLGKGETSSPLPEYFRPVERALKIYRRHGPHVLLARGRVRDGVSGARVHATAGSPREAGDPRAASRLLAGMPRARLSAPFHDRAESERVAQVERVATLLLDSPIGLAVIDRRYDIVVINKAARTFLNVHGIGVGDDLLHTASGIASDELRAAIDAAFGGETPPPREFEVRDALTDVTRTLLVTCQPQRDESEQTPNVAIMMVDLTGEATSRRDAERTNAELRGRLDELGAKLEQLMTRQRALLISNDELTAANAELRSTNEHLLITAEEAASSTEEIERLNEEMQATNEELETLNEELQATVEELNATNDELAARGAEFKEQAAASERGRVDAASERDRLGIALNSARDADGTGNGVVLPLEPDRARRSVPD